MTRSNKINTIRMLCIEITNKHKSFSPKRKRELEKLKKFVKETEIFKGHKRKVLKMIKRFSEK